MGLSAYLMFINCHSRQLLLISYLHSRRRVSFVRRSDHVPRLFKLSGKGEDTLEIKIISQLDDPVLVGRLQIQGSATACLARRRSKS